MVLPPVAQIGEVGKATLGVGESVFVNDKTGIVGAIEHSGFYFVEDKFCFVGSIGVGKGKEEIGGGVDAGYGYAVAVHLRHIERLTSYEQRAYTLAQRTATVQECILVNHPEKGTVTEFGDIELAFFGPMIEGFDIFHDVRKCDAMGVYLAIYHGIEDKSIVGAGAEAEREVHKGSR